MTVEELIYDSRFINTDTMIYIYYNGENIGHYYDNCILELYEKEIINFKYYANDNTVYVEILEQNEKG